MESLRRSHLSPLKCHHICSRITPRDLVWATHHHRCINRPTARHRRMRYRVRSCKTPSPGRPHLPDRSCRHRLVCNCHPQVLEHIRDRLTRRILLGLIPLSSISGSRIEPRLGSTHLQITGNNLFILLKPYTSLDTTRLRRLRRVRTNIQESRISRLRLHILQLTLRTFHRTSNLILLARSSLCPQTCRLLRTRRRHPSYPNNSNKFRGSRHPWRHNRRGLLSLSLLTLQRLRLVRERNLDHSPSSWLESSLVLPRPRDDPSGRIQIAQHRCSCQSRLKPSP